MKLLVPVTSPNDIRLFLEVADDIEFYAGIEIERWYERFGRYEDLNRMSSFHNTANITNMDSVCRLVEEAKGHELFITFNASGYSEEQIEFLEKILEELAQSGVTGIIAGDPFLALKIKECGLKAVASTMIGVYNEDIARFCVQLGFQRLILPRDLSLEEVKEIMTVVPNVEYECFLMRNGCRYSDANCLARHSEKYGALCSFLDKSAVTFCGQGVKTFSGHDQVVFNHHVYTKAFHKSACGMCAIWDLMQMGVSAGKIVGRADGANSIVKDLEMLEKNLRISQECMTREEYLRQMIPPRQYDAICYQGCNCYYPEVRYGRNREKI